MLRRALIATAVLCLAGAGTARANVDVTHAGGKLVVTGTDAAENVGWSVSGANLLVKSNAAVTSSDASCTVGVNQVTCNAALLATLTGLTASMGGGNDSTTYAGPNSLPAGWAATVDGGAGDDLLGGAGGDDTLNGGDGNDTLTSDAGNDHLNGGAGDDQLRTGVAADGTDVLSGGDGWDIADYSTRSAAVTVTIGSGANDGESNENDDVQSDVEQVSGGAGDDTLTGTDGPNTIFGNAGNDTISGAGGPDLLSGNDGDDHLLARDGLVDTVNCGGGTDVAQVDTRTQPDLTITPVDITYSCEGIDGSDAALADKDGDGVTVAAGDCDDTKANVYPGAPDFYNNNIDEDCDGADDKNFDVDGDGYSPPADCNDRDPAIKPTAKEIYGNSIDENCDHKVDKAVPIKTSFTATWKPGQNYTLSKRFIVRGAPLEATVAVACKGGKAKGCPFTRVARLVETRLAPQDFTAKLNKAKLKPGAVIQVTASLAGGYITRIDRYTIKKLAYPTHKTTCIQPGAVKEGKC